MGRMDYGGDAWMFRDPDGGVADAPSARPSACPLGRCGLAGLHVLVAGESTPALDEALAQAGCVVRRQADGPSALVLAASGAWFVDLLVMHAPLPHLDVAELAGMLRADRPWLPLLLLAGSGTPPLPRDPDAGPARVLPEGTGAAEIHDALGTLACRAWRHGCGFGCRGA